MNELVVYKLAFNLLNENIEDVWDETEGQSRAERFYAAGVLDLVNALLEKTRQQAKDADPSDYAKTIPYTFVPEELFVTGMTSTNTEHVKDKAVNGAKVY